MVEMFCELSTNCRNERGQVFFLIASHPVINYPLLTYSLNIVCTTSFPARYFYDSNRLLVNFSKGFFRIEKKVLKFNGSFYYNYNFITSTVKSL